MISSIFCTWALKFRRLRSELVPPIAGTHRRCRSLRVSHVAVRLCDHKYSYGRIGGLRHHNIVAADMSIFSGW